MERIKTINQQHDELDLVLDRAFLLARGGPGPLGESRYGAVLAKELATLRRLLEAHFALEEEGTYLADVRTRRPTLGRKLEAIQKQHAAFRNELTYLMDRPRGPGWTQALRGDLLALLRRLMEHERAERLLYQSALLEDMGAGD